MKLTPKQQIILDSFEISEPTDFLRHVPSRYEVLFPKEVTTWEKGELVIFEGELLSDFKTFRYGPKQSKTSFEVKYNNSIITVVLFNRPYLRSSHYQNGAVVIGTVQDNGQVVARTLNNQDLASQTGIIPIYPLKKNIKQYEIRRLITKILKETTQDNIIPNKYIEDYRLMDRNDAIKEIHQPQSLNHLKLAQRTLKYEELLTFHLYNALNATDTSHGISKILDPSLLEQHIKDLPYELTSAQLVSLNEINKDLMSSKRMYRLLQGDVGSGKTVVTFLSALSVIHAGYQVCFMVPTEILMAQHAQSFKTLFPNIPFETLSSSQDDREKITQKLMTGEVQFVIGTHALFQDDIKFQKLAYVIIDEQHRFGVAQRESLISKGNKVDVLMLSATPIPRSLASSIYFDLDVSTIESYPKHRTLTKTHFIQENSIRSCLNELHKRLESGDQIYVVCPSIEDSKRLKTRNVIDIYESLKVPFEDYSLGYIHGRMSTEDKEKVMHDFRCGALNILVATTIIEVGIDIPNANTMVIYNAEMFGLSTLHQLRGRIGRHQTAGLCYVLSSNENDDLRERLTSFSEIHDGFKLSMMDLKTRGMGDLLGDRQSGLPTFIFSDLEKDINILKQAKIDAKEIAEKQDDADNKAIVKYTKHQKNGV